MSWNVLQSASTAASGAASTQAATYGTNLTSGTKLIAVVSVNSATTTIATVKDGSSNSFTELVNLPFALTLGQVSLWVLDTPAGDIGTKPVITATTVSGNALISILVQEVSGLVTGTSPEALFDGTPGTLTGLGGSSTGSPGYESLADREFLISVYGDAGGETWTKPSNLATADANSINSNAHANIAVAYGNSTDGTEGGSWALTGSAAQWGTILGAFRLSGGMAFTYPQIQAGPVRAKLPRFPVLRGRVQGIVPKIIQLVSNFEGGTSGTTITTGNSGSSGNAFDVINLSSGASVTFDNTHAAHGSLACKLATTTPGGGAYVEWSTSLGTQSEIWFRMYAYVPSLQNLTFIVFNSAVGATCAELKINASGKILFQNAALTTILTSTNTVPVNQWFRLEGFVVASATTGQLSFSLYESMDSVTPTETQASAASQVLAANVGQVAFGIAGITNAGPYWIDDIGISNTGYLGPVPASGGYAEDDSSNAALFSMLTTFFPFQ